LLEPGSRIVESTLLERFIAAGVKPETFEVTTADFDGVMFNVGTKNPNAKNEITISISWRATDQLLKNGARQKMEQEYKGLCVDAVAGYDFSIRVDTNSLPGKPEDVAKNIALMKRHLLGGPLYQISEVLLAKKPFNELIQIDYHLDETIWLKTSSDRIIVIFSVNFKEKDDLIYGKLFLQEFSRLISGAPVVDVKIGVAPAELPPKVVETARGKAEAFVTFVLESRHYTGASRERTVNGIFLFRNYLHYHIKCCKANLHIHMRIRVSSLLQVLNRAKQVVEVKKVTAKGKTFSRKQ